MKESELDGYYHTHFMTNLPMKTIRFYPKEKIFSLYAALVFHIKNGIYLLLFLYLLRGYCSIPLKMSVHKNRSECT